MNYKQNSTATLDLNPEIVVQVPVKAVPEWVNPQNFEEIVRAKLPQFEKIVAFKVYPALAPGEKYATLLFRISIDAQLNDKSTSKLSYMMKVPHDSEEMRQVLKFSNFFQHENMVLQTILPELEDMYNNAGINIRFGPIAKKFSKDFGDYVLMEGIDVDGFRNANGLECLDMVHTELVLEKLAKYHAASAVRAAEKGPYPNDFVDGVNPEVAKQMWMATVSGFRDVFLNNLGNLENGERYRKSFERFFNNLSSEINVLMRPSKEILNILAHGDCWRNNILFKYTDDGKPIDIIFVNFQATRWSTPLQDILYFIISSIRVDIKLSKFNYFLRFYYDHLIENLKLLRYLNEMPKLSDFHIHALQVGSWGVIAAIMILPIIIVDPEEYGNFENFMCADEAGLLFQNGLYRNKGYIQYINELLLWFYERGTINDE